MSGAMNRRCIPGLTMSTADRELLYRECPGIIEAVHRVWRIRIALCQRPGADTEETGRYDLAWKDAARSVLWMLSSK